jgi:hypothetical protein
VKSANKPNETLTLPFERVLRAFEEAGVKHLIMGGQAVVAYGASQFTQDADFWVEPTARNLVRLRNALASLHARQRFLPPLELQHLKRGHGIHFALPHGDETYYIDLLGKARALSDSWLLFECLFGYQGTRNFATISLASELPFIASHRLSTWRESPHGRQDAGPLPGR